jgi:hypothetical protein
VKWLLRWLKRPRSERPEYERTETKGAEAVREALDNLGDAKSRWPEVNAVSQSLRELRERNHFAEQIQNIFEGGPR